ncbi:3-deoxy-D-manno-octulosonate 8-phosphate phosphatase (KDO 8-P phosphatase) [Hydrobacter penzbergensis]|jgi:3-deoxy-D-manno-octulosonate 8-phosphate phosphatase (KDO 8-P phosphatase)|uniref:3-deoxy-D-manno-octulosonate 8-phosphate phosphatase (KDO 8-P phosphatase) n=1 Tax=Hydrobacter penzbergensis TaxID=1235997 RepID=A0A8X8LCU4_9BACT|nr:HAD hydrolase-like protein [Hydrobacter penzbergensis]KHD90172.1 3-deoxy-D-manno-octulosonate 8-phosphate phosphatase [candidate division TM6 bacterium Zodletone_IIa]MBN8717843.1 HAD hydrolase-like protein [Sediminibacterium magnilacihabitans]PQV61433.1 3-deoxy-D-manno-octulosonate 8-phosphate phosphatase (KDO 8-P phosphatase) [Sediminibacterium magnilacihabitans]SDW46933.1 3-deoxy-D-manno-octulosonate 8-phosphate phosphatase (KDO 8-P phosphatase) [Hydrobacter penzbergensis]
MLERFKPITAFVFDVDGVLTDGSLLVLPGGVMARRMNIKDGYALQLAVKKGYKVAVISGGNSDEVNERLNKLGVEHVWMKVENKVEVLKAFMHNHNINSTQLLYMGDDIPDIKAMDLAGLPCCPADAAQEIRKKSLYVSRLKGGEGCVRDVIEKVMRLRGDWNEDFSIRAQ